MEPVPVISAARHGLVDQDQDQINDLQARLAASETKIASLERALKLALKAMDRFAELEG